MLVITRKEGEGLMIGENIALVVQHVGGSRVRLSLDTPKNLDVYRMEKYMQDMEDRPPADNFPRFYRLWQQAVAGVPPSIRGYALNVEGLDEARFIAEPIESQRDLRKDDSRVDIYMFSTRGQAEAFITGLNRGLEGNTLGKVMENRGGVWYVLVEDFSSKREGSFNIHNTLTERRSTRSN